MYRMIKLTKVLTDRLGEADLRGEEVREERLGSGVDRALEGPNNLT